MSQTSPRRIRSASRKRASRSSSSPSSPSSSSPSSTSSGDVARTAGYFAGAGAVGGWGALVARGLWANSGVGAAGAAEVAGAAGAAEAAGAAGAASEVGAGLLNNVVLLEVLGAAGVAGLVATGLAVSGAMEMDGPHDMHDNTLNPGPSGSEDAGGPGSSGSEPDTGGGHGQEQAAAKPGGDSGWWAAAAGVGGVALGGTCALLLAILQRVVIPLGLAPTQALSGWKLRSHLWTELTVTDYEAVRLQVIREIRANLNWVRDLSTEEKIRMLKGATSARQRRKIIQDWRYDKAVEEAEKVISKWQREAYGEEADGLVVGSLMMPLTNTATVRKTPTPKGRRDLIVFCGGAGSTLDPRPGFKPPPAEDIVSLVRGRMRESALINGHKLQANQDHPVVRYESSADDGKRWSDEMQAVDVVPQARQEHESGSVVADVLMRSAQKIIDTNLDRVAEALDKESSGGRIALVGHSLGGYQAARLAYLIVRLRHQRQRRQRRRAEEGKRARAVEEGKITWIGVNTFSNAAAILSSAAHLKYVCKPVFASLSGGFDTLSLLKKAYAVRQAAGSGQMQMQMEVVESRPNVEFYNLYTSHDDLLGPEASQAINEWLNDAHQINTEMRRLGSDISSHNNIDDDKIAEVVQKSWETEKSDVSIRSPTN